MRGARAERLVSARFNELQDAVTASIARIKGARCQALAAAREAVRGNPDASLTRCATAHTTSRDETATPLFCSRRGQENLAPVKNCSSVPGLRPKLAYSIRACKSARNIADLWPRKEWSAKVRSPIDAPQRRIPRGNVTVEARTLPINRRPAFAFALRL